MGKGSCFKLCEPRKSGWWCTKWCNGTRKNIFEVARENQVEILILGAFGCGAFKNPPEVVAEAFQQVIVEQNYLREFKHIVFAIKPTGEDCPNVKAFAGKFEPLRYLTGQLYK